MSLCNIDYVNATTGRMDRRLGWNQRPARFCLRIKSTTCNYTSRVTNLPRSILASACRSSDRCAIERSNNKTASFEFRMRDVRTTIPPHITTAIAMDTYTVSKRAGALINISPFRDLCNEHWIDYFCIKLPAASLFITSASTVARDMLSLKKKRKENKIRSAFELE